MLRILRPIGAGLVFAFQDQRLRLVVDETTGPRVFEFNPGLLMFPNHDPIIEIDGSISTTPSNVLPDENNCHHVTIDGNVVPRQVLTISQPLALDQNYAPDSFYYNELGLVSGMGKTLQYDYYAIKNIARRGYKWVRDVKRSSFFITEFIQWGTPLTVERKFNCIWPGSNATDGKVVKGIGYFAYTIRYLSPTSCVVCCGITDCPDDHPAHTTLYAAYVRHTSAGAHVKLFNWGYCVYNTLMRNADELNRFVDRNKSSEYNLTGYDSWEPQPCLWVNWFLTFPLTGVVQAPLEKALDNQIKNNALSHAMALLPYSKPDVGDMSYDCVQQTQTWSGNGVALAHDLITLREQVQSIIPLLKNWRNPKSWASLFLSYEYGVPLTFKDMKSLIESIQSLKPTSDIMKVSSSRTWSETSVSYESHYGIYYSYWDDYFDMLTTYLEQFHIIPDYSDQWDLIPFSFVIDWFINVGGLLDRYDAQYELTKFHLHGSCLSLKASRIVTMEQLGFYSYLGSVRISSYDRTFDTYVTPPSARLSDLTPNSFDHWVEGLALIVQKILH